MDTDGQLSQFHFLTPDTILTIAEEAFDAHFTSLCRPYKSYINRVYELEREDGESFVIKFYRPARWSREALQDEHDFLLDLVQDEIPVIAPLPLVGGGTLGEYQDTYFAIFPKKGGRSVDEFTEEQWLELGRLMGRVHVVGARRKPVARIQFTPDAVTKDQIAFLCDGGFIEPDLIGQFKEVTDVLLHLIIPLFKGKQLLRIHGDCHFANLIHRPGESLYLIDLDDMATGTPIQDVWMLLPGYLKDSHNELNLFVEGYETFRTFDYSDRLLIEPLRAMRYIHYTAWCAHQAQDGGFSQLMPDWGVRQYWQTEVNDLRDQIQVIEKVLRGEP